MRAVALKRIARQHEKTCDFSGVVQVKLAVGGASVDLDGLFRNAVFAGNLFVGVALGNHADDFALALRERLETVAEVGDFALAAALGEVVRDGVFNVLRRRWSSTGF